MPIKSYEIEHGTVAKAKDDEMLFVLRANDPHAPMIVEIYANIMDMTDEKEKAISARQIANGMRVWRHENR